QAARRSGFRAKMKIKAPQFFNVTLCRPRLFSPFFLSGGRKVRLFHLEQDRSSLEQIAKLGIDRSAFPSQILKPTRPHSAVSHQTPRSTKLSSRYADDPSAFESSAFQPLWRSAESRMSADQSAKTFE